MTPSLLQFHRQSKVMKTITLFVIVSLIHTSCFQHFYKVDRDDAPDGNKIATLEKAPNYILIHRGRDVQRMTSVKYNESEGTIYGDLVPWMPERHQYLNAKKDGRANLYKKSEAYVLDEVHIYLKDTLTDISSGVIPISNIDHLDINNPHKGATTTSQIMSGIGVTAGVLGIIALIAVLTKSSCPFVYVKNGDGYEFSGEIYSGAIYKCMERDDYLMMSFERGDIVEFKIANHLKEKQFINHVEMMVVQHEAESKIVPDRHGNLHKINESDFMAPLATVNTSSIAEADLNYHIFCEKQTGKTLPSLSLSFANPIHKKEAVLTVVAKNSMFGDYVFGEFTKLFGSQYDEWIALQRNGDAQEHLQWAQDQGLLLKAYIKTKKGWEFVDYFNPVGPLGERDLAMKLDLTRVAGDIVEIKLESGFMFWEINKVTLSYNSMQVKGERLEFEAARTKEGSDVSSLIADPDQQYLEQPSIGDEASFQFKAPVLLTSSKQTYFLHVKGYYEHVRDYEGVADVTALHKLREPGSFSKFSEEKLDELMYISRLATIGIPQPETIPQ